MKNNYCEDAASRKEAIDTMKHWFSDMLETGKEKYSIDDVLNGLPPVTPTRKKGKWIKYEKGFIESGSYRQIKKPVIECSICQWKIAGFVGVMKF